MLRRFVPRTSETAYIYLMKGSGCSSTVGRSGSRQTVSLGLGCVYSGEQTVMLIMLICFIYKHRIIWDDLMFLVAIDV